jgi:hypothetical protein
VRRNEGLSRDSLDNPRDLELTFAFRHYTLEPLPNYWMNVGTVDLKPGEQNIALTCQ